MSGEIRSQGNKHEYDGMGGVGGEGCGLIISSVRLHVTRLGHAQFSGQRGRIVFILIGY